MGTFSIWHWLVVLVVVLVLFGGGGKISRLMGDFGKGLTSFKKGMKEEEKVASEKESPKTLRSETTADTAEPAPKKDQAAEG